MKAETSGDREVDPASLPLREQSALGYIRATVGPAKPLTDIGGDFGRTALFGEKGMNITSVAAVLSHEGYSVWTRGIGDNADPIREAVDVASYGRLVVADQESLQALLDSRAVVLAAYDWPVDVDAFVRTVFERYAQPFTQLYDVVADAFGDNNAWRFDQQV